MRSGEIDGKTLVCDEEDGVTVEMSALAANTRAASALVQRPAPLPVPGAPAQRQPAQAALPRLRANGAADGGDTKQQFYSALEGDDEEFEPRAPQVCVCLTACCCHSVLCLVRGASACACLFRYMRAGFTVDGWPPPYVQS